MVHSEHSLYVGGDAVDGDYCKGQISPQRGLGWHLGAVAICTQWVVATLRRLPAEDRSGS